jgi:small subunit ribosomal protein S20
MQAAGVGGKTLHRSGDTIRRRHARDRRTIEVGVILTVHDRPATRQRTSTISKRVRRKCGVNERAKEKACQDEDCVPRWAPISPEKRAAPCFGTSECGMISWIFANAFKEQLVPNIKAAIKWTRASEKRRKRNLSAKTKLKTLVKKAGAENADLGAVTTASSALDKAAARGIIHKNKAARQKSRMAKKTTKKA